MIKIKDNNFITGIYIEIIIIIISLVGYIFMPIILKTSKDTSFTISIVAILLSVVVISLKHFIFKSLLNVKSEFSESIALANTLTQKVARIKFSYLNYAKELLKKTHEHLNKIEKGIIPLLEDDYYNAIIEESFNLTKNDSVFAVNSFEELRFKDDPRQIRYFNSNIKAVKERDVIFKRIFIIDSKTIKTEIGKKRLEVIKENISKGINVKIVDKNELKGKNDLLDDWVLFSKQDGMNHLYVDYQDLVEKTRVISGELILNESIINDFKKKFISLEKYAYDEDKMKQIFG